MSIKEAYKIVLEDLKKCNLLCGIYDAKNGNESFMYGISTVMESIAYNAEDEDFADMFLSNMMKSQSKVKEGNK